MASKWNTTTVLGAHLHSQWKRHILSSNDNKIAIPVCLPTNFKVVFLKKVGFDKNMFCQVSVGKDLDHITATVMSYVYIYL